tara:strand:+ start:2681 stop:3925 length:1245 start_codon:yes stop_codon:yes gene_type:complete
MSVAFDSNVTLTCEIAFDSDPLDSSQTFTDVSSFLRGFKISRGRASNLSQFQPGTALIQLDNSDNRFSPNQTTHFFDSSNNRTKVQPLKRIRIKAAQGGTTYTLFHGFVESFPVNYGLQGQDSTTNIKAVDVFKLLNNATLDSVGWKLGTSLLGQTTRLAFGQAQELSSIRATNILNSFGYTNQAISTGQLQVQTQSTTDTLLAALQAVERAENGTFFIAANGNATFRDRNFRLTNTTTPDATFGQGGSDLPYTDIVSSYDDTKIINTVLFTRTGGSQQSAVSDDSVQRFGTHSLTQSGRLNIQDSDVSSIAKQKVVENDIPQTSVRTLIFRPQSNISIWAKALGLDIGAFVKTNVLTPSGTTESYDLFIENIQHSVDARSKTWTWKIGLSPAETGAWILGVSKLGIDTNISYT